MCNREVSNLSDQELLVELKRLKGSECEVLAEIVKHLAQVDVRQSYRDYGYSSLYALCTVGLKYSEGAAQRRIVAARCLRENCEVYELLREGKISLCSLSQVAKVITPENKAEVLSLSQGLPKEEAQRLAARYLPPERAKRETIRAKRVVVDKITATVNVTATVEERFSVNVEVDAECRELIDQAKRYSGCGKISEMLKVVLKDYVARKAPKVKEVRAAAKSTRYIPRAVKDQVRIRDEERCTFVAEDGTRCCERGRLEFDHELPFSRGGDTSVENLRLTCRAHNQLYAERVFGQKFMHERREISVQQ